MADEALSVIARFEVRRRRYLAPDGTAAGETSRLSRRTQRRLISLYRAMVLTRTFDLKAVSLQRTGRLGTYAVSLGQEAVSVGVASAMRQEDVLLPSYRDNGALLWRGVKMEEILLYWGGDERGSHSSGPRARFPVLRTGRLAGAARCRRRLRLQAPQGAARRRVPARRRRHLQGRRLRGDELRRRAQAARWCSSINNNQWAISVPLKLQTASRDPGAEGDRRRLRRASRWTATTSSPCATRPRRRWTARAAARGRALIEAVTYRLGDHTTADDAARYRPPEEVQARWKEEPIARLRAYLVSQQGVGQGRGGAALRRMPEPGRGRRRALSGHARPRAAGDHVRSLYAELPRAYAGQRDELKGASHG